MSIRRSLVETPSGFVHVRAAGSGSPILLLHWTPASSRQYVPVLDKLGDSGFAGYAPDNMGYGQSDPRPAPWLVKDYADNIAAVMDGLGLESAAVVGGHVSSEFAVELSLRHPERVTHLVLDGCP
ncbi:MAG: alpha/beta fold hydrolase, partial [Anaerolineaceae bacterium]|nr:alpha/beta fold hydrolase [Anaerolineaceae bacterium]